MLNQFSLSSRWVLLVALTFGWALTGCGPQARIGSESEADDAPYNCTKSQENGGILLDCPAPPDTDLVTASEPKLTNANGQVDKFAWNTFIALNWPAILPAADNDYLRGVPNTQEAFKTAQPETMTVWETFKEKREVFNIGTVKDNNFEPMDPGFWNSQVDYGPLRTATQEDLAQDIPRGVKVLRSGIEMAFNGLDETIEVLGEAREPDSAVQGAAVAPRVWLADSVDNASTPVLYEVKVNFDFYDYVRDNHLYDDAQAAAKAGWLCGRPAKNPQIHLPFRTSALATPGPATLQELREGAPASSQTAAKVNYSAEAAAKIYNQYTELFIEHKTAPEAGLQFFIPRIGSVHIKAAWIKLSDLPLDELSKEQRQELQIDTYHVADATYYVTELEQPIPVPKSGTFALIGFHIIQRIHVSDDKQRFTKRGGTFVFASWEHDSIEDPADGKEYRYSNFYDPRVNGQFGTPRFVPPVDNAYKVTRRPEAILMQTQHVNDLVHGMLPADSVWQHYNLIGTQFAAVNTVKTVFSDPPSAAEKELGQNSFLANLVIETNYGLQNFRGLPPNLTEIIQPYCLPDNGGKSKPIKGNPNFAAFDREALNISWASGSDSGNRYNMGGCMGCHGVAQIQGYNFSFVLLGGNDGAETDTQDRFDLPLSNIKNKH